MSKARDLADFGDDISDGVISAALDGDGSALTGVNAFKPTTVSGASQALDIGTYNFFNADEVNEDVTLTFSNVPTEARWSYSFKPKFTLESLWDLSNITSIRSYSLARDEAGVFFSPDGFKFYTCYRASVRQFNLSQSFNTSTVVSVDTLTITPYYTVSIRLSPDGTRMYVLESDPNNTTTDVIHQYSLTTPWDITTASFLTNTSVSAQEAATSSFFFKPDGTKMYVTGTTGDDINEYNLTTPWVVSSKVYSKVFSVSAQVTSPRGLAFKEDGSEMYLTGYSSILYRYNLSTPWDVSTATYSGYVSLTTTYASDICFSHDGGYLFVMDGITTVSLKSHQVGVASSITLPSTVENPPTLIFGPTDFMSYDFFTADGGSTVTLISEEKE